MEVEIVKIIIIYPSNEHYKGSVDQEAGKRHRSSSSISGHLRLSDGFIFQKRLLTLTDEEWWRGDGELVPSDGSSWWVGSDEGVETLATSDDVFIPSSASTASESGETEDGEELAEEGRGDAWLSSSMSCPDEPFLIHLPEQQGSISSVARELELLQSDSRRTNSKLLLDGSSSWPGRTKNPSGPEELLLFLNVGGQ